MREVHKYSSPSEVASTLSRIEKRATKGLGQNFLIDDNVLTKIIEASGLGKRTAVIEVGPGLGALTSRLIQAAGRVVAIEIDDKLWDYLEEEFGTEEHFELIKSDVLKVDLKEVCERLVKDYDSIMLISNLPYQITTPLLMKVLEEYLPIAKTVVMVQLELADRLAAREGGKDYGALTVSVNTYAEVQKLFEVKPGSFLPRPKVSSAVIELKPKENQLSEALRKQLLTLVKAAFHARRKKMLNSITGSTDISKEAILKALQEMGLREDVRAEMLSPSQFEDFARRIYGRDE